MTLMELVIGALLMGLVAFLVMHFYTKSEDLVRASSTRQTAMESLRAVQVRVDQKLRERMHPKLSQLFLGKPTVNFFGPGSVFSTSSLVLRKNETKRYENFKAMTRCVSVPNMWKDSYGTFIKDTAPCDLGCADSERPVIFMQWAVKNKPDGGTTGVGAKSATFPTYKANKSANFLKVAAAAGFCFDLADQVDVVGTSRSMLRMHYFAYFVDVDRKLQMVERVSQIGDDLNAKESVFYKAIED